VSQKSIADAKSKHVSCPVTKTSPAHLAELDADAADVEGCQLLEGLCLQVDLLRAALVAVVVQHDGQDLGWVTHLQQKTDISRESYCMRAQSGTGWLVQSMCAHTVPSCKPWLTDLVCALNFNAGATALQGLALEHAAVQGHTGKVEAGVEL
jgi:hypothetical protein